MKDEKGKRVPMGNQANTAATFLEKQAWGKTDEQRNDENAHVHDAAPRIITHEEVGINTGPITLYEVRKIVNKLKRRKTPGPDGIPIEFLKEMDDEALERVRALLNNWWGSEHIPEDVLRARVVLIFKKGDKEDLANYRPISLLNTIYKVLAAIVQDRIATKLDKFLQKTQYGFRQKRGTADAIHYVRRMIDKGERTGTKTLLVLLDWEKAFDKVLHHKLLEALTRMNIPSKIINIVRAMYTQPTFCVEKDGTKSEWKAQETGIRQGCPLSPYLFIIPMTVMFDDIHHGDKLNLKKQRVIGTEHDEVLYADDTICIAQNEQAMNRLLAAIETEGKKYGMRLNKNKCEYLPIGGREDRQIQERRTS